MTTRPDDTRLRLVAVGLAIALVVMTVVAVALFVLYRSAAADDDRIAAAEEGRKQACLYASELIAFDYRSLDEYFERMTAGATGEWKSTFESTVDQTREAVTGGRTIASAGDVQCGLVTGDDDTATVVIAAGQSIVSGDPPSAPRSTQVYMVALMSNEDGRWLCSKLVTSLHGD